MLSEEQKNFILYWEKNRDKEKKILYRLVLGLPLGLVFALPILLSVIFHEWYKSMVYISSSEITVVMIAVLGIVVFFALFRMKFKWENNEQLYKELKLKDESSHAADL